MKLTDAEYDLLRAVLRKEYVLVDRGSAMHYLSNGNDMIEKLATMANAIERKREEVDKFIDIVFDGPPSHESGRFVEVEDGTGASVNAGEWIDRGNGLWALRIRRLP